MSNLHRSLIIAASCSLSAVLGTIHAFSVFVNHWANLPNADIASVSLIYSLALGSLTVAVLLGYRLYQQLSPCVMFLLVGVLAATGLWLSASASSITMLYVTYGVIFGGANGLGYGYALQLSGQSAPNIRGMAMGLVTAFYAVGATAAPPLFFYLIDNESNKLALQVMSVIILIVAVMGAAVVYWAQANYQSEPAAGIKALSAALKRARLLLWLGYGSAVTAGLMVIGHAHSIASWMSLDTKAATVAATVVVFGNMLGGFSAGYCSDRFSSRALLCWLPLVTSIGLGCFFLPLSNLSLIVFLGLGIVGYCYGAIIAVYPVAVADVFGAAAAPRIYGQVFTAWGLAGFIGPGLGGWLFDQSGGYSMAFVIAMLLSFASIIAIRLCLPGSSDWAH